MSPETYVPSEHLRQEPKILYIGWHQDDIEATMFALLDAHAAYGAHQDMVSISHGELGIPPELTDMTPEKMAEIRDAEFESSARALHMHGYIFDYPDVYMGESLKPAIEQVTEIVRRNQYDLVVSYHPTYYAREIDHPSHPPAGVIAQYVALASTRLFMSQYPAMRERPKLMYRQDWALSTHEVVVTQQTQDCQIDHLIRYYPSQYRSRDGLTPIFDRVTDTGIPGKKAEGYVLIR
jgi:LmbE family N-acetylglucosaminyl deacetylase